MCSTNTITAEEMAVATDPNAPASPEKFIPYRKVLSELVSMHSIICDATDVLMELESLFGQIEKETVNSRSLNSLAGLGKRVASSHSMTLSEILDTSTEVSDSARNTLPRKRWDDSGAPDDKPDDDDLTREANAAVPPHDDEDGK